MCAGNDNITMLLKKTAASERAMKWSVVQLSALIEWVENKEADLFGRL